MAARYVYVRKEEKEEDTFDPNNPDYEELIGLTYSTEDVIKAICETVTIPTNVIDVTSILTGTDHRLLNDYIALSNANNNSNNPTNTINTINTTDANNENENKSQNTTNNNENNNDKNNDNSNNNNNNSNLAVAPTTPTMENRRIKTVSTEMNLPREIAIIIISYIRIPRSKFRESMKIFGEIWVRCDSKHFQHSVEYLKVSYPWVFENRKLNLEVDSFCEGIELWQRYRINKKYDVSTIGSVLNDDFMSYFKEIIKKNDNRAYRVKPNDLITLYKVYVLFNSIGVSTSDIVSKDIKKENFLKNWDLYGDNVETLSHDLAMDDIEKWRQSVEMIQHFKKILLKEVLDTLYPIDDPTAIVRRIHLSNDVFKDNVKYLYDLYIGQNGVLIQKIHSD